MVFTGAAKRINAVAHYIGVDLGGTHLRAALVDTQNGAVVALEKVATPALQGPPAVEAAILKLVQAVIAQGAAAAREIGGVGIGVPGLVDLDRGIALVVPNIPGDWAALPLQADLRQALGRPVHLINDVRAITLGEWTFGAGRGVDTLACYAIGTGIGGGVIVDNRLHLGISGSAGEIGHQVVELNGLACNCGGRGCLEMYASGTAMAANAIKAVAQRRHTLIGALAGNDLNNITLEIVVQAAQQGDAVALEIFEQAGAYLGMAVANTLLTISPRRVVFAGGAAAAGELLLGPVRRLVSERVHLVPVDQVEFVRATLGDDGGLLGSALWAQQRVEQAG
jgi:glucokinase